VALRQERVSGPAVGVRRLRGRDERGANGTAHPHDSVDRRRVRDATRGPRE
jgi:hypothetical protein